MQMERDLGKNTRRGESLGCRVVGSVLKDPVENGRSEMGERGEEGQEMRQ